MTQHSCILIAAVGLFATAASADLHTANTYVQGRLCVGADCANNEGFGEATLKLKQTVTRLTFEDTSATANFPANNWQLWVNDDFEFGLDRFTIRDRTGDTMPFTIEAGAPDNAIWIEAISGDIGIGTTMPVADIHISRGLPSIRLETDGTSGSYDPYIWDIVATNYGFSISDSTNLTTPFFIAPNSEGYALAIKDDAVGVGAGGFFKAKLHVDLDNDDGTYPYGFFLTDGSSSANPAAMAHIQSVDGNAKLFIEEKSGTSSPRTLLNLRNNGRPEIIMGNINTGGEWSFGAGSNFVLKQGGVGSASSSKTKLFEIKPNGDATLTGSLVTGGTTCGGGCDRVFSDDYDLPSIADHAEAMFALGHLPNVGPTIENEPINVSDKLGRMLNELEHAHIYIARLEADKASLERRMASLEAVVAELQRQQGKR